MIPDGVGNGVWRFLHFLDFRSCERGKGGGRMVVAMRESEIADQ